MGWCSKVGRSGRQTAHFVDLLGPLCSRIVFGDGKPALHPFKCEWGPEKRGRFRDKRCGHCSRLSRGLTVAGQRVEVVQ